MHSNTLFYLYTQKYIRKVQVNNQQPKRDTAPINEQIRAPIVIVIDDKGVNLGEMPIAIALEKANKKNLDLVLISNKGSVPITKILDYSKFKYEQKRKQKQNKKNQVIVKQKEIKIKPLIGDHDLLVRATNAKKWLDDGNRVLFVILAKGRLATKVEMIDAIHEKFMSMLEEKGKLIQDRKKTNEFRFESIIVPNKK